MLVAQGASHVMESARSAIVLFAILAIVFGNVLLRIVVTFVAIAVVVFVAYGAITLMQGLSRP